MQVEKRIQGFKHDLTTLSPVSVVRKHIIDNDCYALDRDQHFALRSRISDHFRVTPHDVIIVGSGKLGFSIADGKRYRPFNDTSDIDVAIISELQFDAIWQAVFDASSEDSTLRAELNGFKDYLFRGWIRPDQLPRRRAFAFAKEWHRLMDSLTSSGDYGPYAIRAGLYRTHHFLESYQSINVGTCMRLQSTAGITR